MYELMACDSVNKQINGALLLYKATPGTLYTIVCL